MACLTVFCQNDLVSGFDNVGDSSNIAPIEKKECTVCVLFSNPHHDYPLFSFMLPLILSYSH